MLQTCSPGLSVVNVDNGIGAGVTAASSPTEPPSAARANPTAESRLPARPEHAGLRRRLPTARSPGGAGRARRGLPIAGEVRLTPTANVHLTLKFLGDVPEDDLGQVAEALEPLREEHEPFEAGISGFELFLPKKARVCGPASAKVRIGCAPWPGRGKVPGASRFRARRQDLRSPPYARPGARTPGGSGDGGEDLARTRLPGSTGGSGAGVPGEDGVVYSTLAAYPLRTP